MISVIAVIAWLSHLKHMTAHKYKSRIRGRGSYKNCLKGDATGACIHAFLTNR